MRTWQTNESFNNYYHEKLILGNLVPIEDAADLLDYLVDGIPDQTLRNQARMQNFNSVKDLLNGIRKISLGNRTLKKDSQHGENSAIDKSTNRTKPEAKPQKTSIKEETWDKPVKCYNCNKTGHIFKNCAKPKRERESCYDCGGMGHIAKNCPTRETKESKETKEKLQVSNVYEDPAEEESVEHRKLVTYEVKDSILQQVLCLDTLLDTGSPISFIKERFIGKQGLHPLDSSDRDYGGCKKVKLDLLGKVYSKISIGDTMRENLRVYVVPENTSLTPALLGRGILHKFGIRLTFPTDDSAWREIMNINVIEGERHLVDDLRVNSAIPYEAKIKLKQMFQESYVDCPRQLEPKTKAELKLRLDNPQPFYCTPRKLAYDDKEKLQVILDDLLQKRYIRNSDSEFASPIFLTKKKNGKTRMCVDFRVLNKVTARDNYPMPLIEDQLAIVGNKKYFTLLDWTRNLPFPMLLLVISGR